MSIMLSCRSMMIAVSPVLATMSLLALLVGMDGGAAWAQTGGLSHSPAEIVKKYFELDQKGAKLDSMSFEALAPFRNWDTEPIWGKVVVIREFSVDESEMNALLTRLDTLRIIDLFPGNRVRILIGIRRFEHCTPILRKSIVRNALDVTEAVSHLQKDAFCKMEFLRLGPASLARARALTDAYFDQLIALAKRDLDIVGDQARWYSTASCFAPSSPRGMEKLKESSRTVAARST